MFRKILIANRGEIACRVIRTAREMGIATVAVYSDADAQAMHVAMADEAVNIGAAPVAESYLKGETVIAAAKTTGADAVHPGYGFLSENPEFVDAVNAAGLTFIGPSAKAIRAMGLKDAAKALMEKAGVPVVPGYHGADQDPKRLAAEADKIGYPVLIKARAGGGGKGMRLVEHPKDFAASLASAAREGESAFGDPAVLIEKFIMAPRHIEVQVFGDTHGQVVHLYERDCSLQRRHQKVIEEAPAPGMTKEVRAAMTAAAVRAAKAIDYVGAGTIEFIVDGTGPLRPDGFWFMEMNTRLQVEHPVTEAITGTDLVAWQLRVAAGEPLPLSQDDIPLNGHAFEARLYAEDPARDFLPQTGRISHLTFGDAGRVDTGVQGGDVISPFYDPMIAKLITHGTTRAEALGSLETGLGETHLVGCATNVSFLIELTRHAGFRIGEVDTGLIGRDLAVLISPRDTIVRLMALGLIAASGVDLNAPRLGWRLWGQAEHRVLVTDCGTDLVARVTLSAPAITVAWRDIEVTLSNVQAGFGKISAVHDGRRFSAQLYQDQKCVSLLSDGATVTLGIPDPLAVQATLMGTGNDVTAAMTGTVRAVLVAKGDQVEQGDPVIILEAMKMEHTLAAPRAGVIAEVACAPDDQVAGGAVLLRLEPEDD